MPTVSCPGVLRASAPFVHAAGFGDADAEDDLLLLVLSLLPQAASALLAAMTATSERGREKVMGPNVQRRPAGRSGPDQARVELDGALPTGDVPHDLRVQRL